MHASAVFLRAVVRDDGGQGLVEYAMIVALVSLTCIAALKFFGQSNGSNYNSISGAITTAT